MAKASGITNTTKRITVGPTSPASIITAERSLTTLLSIIEKLSYTSTILPMEKEGANASIS